MKRLTLTLLFVLVALYGSFAQSFQWQESDSYISVGRGIYGGRATSSYGDCYTASHTSLLTRDCGYSLGVNYVEGFDESINIVMVPIGFRWSLNADRISALERTTVAMHHMIYTQGQDIEGTLLRMTPFNIDTFVGLSPLYLFENSMSPFGLEEESNFGIANPFGLAFETSIGFNVRMWRFRLYVEAAYNYNFINNISYYGRVGGLYNSYVRATFGVIYML